MLAKALAPALIELQVCTAWVLHVLSHEHKHDLALNFDAAMYSCSHLMMLTGFRPEGLPSKKWLKPRMNSSRGAAWVRVMLPSMLLLFSTSSTAFLSGLKAMPSSANDTVVRKTPCTQQRDHVLSGLSGTSCPENVWSACWAVGLLVGFHASTACTSNENIAQRYGVCQML